MDDEAAEMDYYRRQREQQLRDQMRITAIKQCNNNFILTYKFELPDLSQELYECMRRMYAVPYPEGREALWTNWKSCGVLPSDGSLRRPTFWEAQIRFNMRNYLGEKAFIACCKEFKAQTSYDLALVRKFEDEILGYTDKAGESAISEGRLGMIC